MIIPGFKPTDALMNKVACLSGTVRLVRAGGGLRDVPKYIIIFKCQNKNGLRVISNKVSWGYIHRQVVQTSMIFIGII